MKYPNGIIHKLKTHDEVAQSYLKPDTPLNDLPTIGEFYAGQEIFITGGSGFIGKVHIEKLLRSCPDLKLIYVLLRSKKGKTAEERLKDLTANCLFDVLRLLNPDFIQKIVPILGDVGVLGLGISDADRERMKNVSIIFHVAASVRFDDTLRDAVIMNTRGTRELMCFAETLSKLKVVMHVSTTYSNVFVHEVEEKIYPPAADWKKTIEICENLDDEQLRNFTEHYTDFMPTTYVFSKNLAEQVTHEFKDKLPVVLFRPSIVTAILQEPFPGWTDNINGPMGICLASALGICKTFWSDPKNVLDFCPVDVVCKAMIIAAWKRAHKPRDIFPVYNCANGKGFKVTIEQFLEMGIHGLCEEFPMEHMVWQAGGCVTLNKTLNYVRMICYQVIPAVFLDLALKFKNQKARLMKIQRRMREANGMVSYFVTHDYDFKNDNFINLNSLLRLEDHKDFDFRNMFTYDITLIARQTLLGQRRYILNEKDESLPKCRRKLARISKVNIAMKIILLMVLIYYVFFKLNLLGNIKEYFNLN